MSFHQSVNNFVFYSIKYVQFHAKGSVFVGNFTALCWVECSPMAQETGVQSQVKSYQNLKKRVLDATLLNTQHYKVNIKGVIQGKE